MAGCVMARRVGGHQQPIAESCNPRGAPTGDGPFWRSSNGCGSPAPCRTTVLCFWGDLGWFGRKIACRAFLCRLPVRRLRGEFQLANVSRRRTFRFGRRLSSLRELQREFRASCEFGRTGTAFWRQGAEPVSHLARRGFVSPLLAAPKREPPRRAGSSRSEGSVSASGQRANGMQQSTSLFIFRTAGAREVRNGSPAAVLRSPGTLPRSIPSSGGNGPKVTNLTREIAPARRIDSPGCGPSTDCHGGLWNGIVPEISSVRPPSLS